MVIILIVVFSFISIGTSLSFFSELAHIRTEMKEQVHGKKHQCMTFTKEAFANLKWEEKNKEFRLHGKMYDVSSMAIDGDKILVYCVFDKDETSFRKNFADMFTDKPGSNSPLRLWVKLLLQNYFTTPEFSMPVLNRGFMTIQYSYVFKVHTFENELADPPPRS